VLAQTCEGARPQAIAIAVECPRPAITPATCAVLCCAADLSYAVCWSILLLQRFDALKSSYECMQEQMHALQRKVVGVVAESEAMRHVIEKLQCHVLSLRRQLHHAGLKPIQQLDEELLQPCPHKVSAVCRRLHGCVWSPAGTPTFGTAHPQPLHVPLVHPRTAATGALHVSFEGLACMDCTGNLRCQDWALHVTSRLRVCPCSPSCPTCLAAWGTLAASAAVWMRTL
jgi:hypothetical protein